MKKTTIIIPCFNEADRFKASEFLKFIADFEDIDLCFVNDGSRDQTLEQIQTLQKQAPERIEVVSYVDNRGKAEAVREGFLQMLALNKYHWFAFADADLATPLVEVHRLIEIARQKEELLVVMGSRLARMGGVIQRKFYRHFTGRIFAGVVSFLFSLNAYDTQCGAKVFHEKIVEEAFRQPFISRWLFDIEILLRVRNSYQNYNQIIQEEPLNVWLEQGNSKIRFSHLLRMPAQLWRIYFKYRK